MTARIRKHVREKQEGFSLVELLVVVIIIGILAAIAIPVFLSQRGKGSDAQAKSALRNAATAEEAALTETNAYVTCGSASTCAGTGTSGLGNQGYRITTGVKLGVVANGNSGFCASVQSQSGNWFYWDSQARGLQPGTSTAFTKPTVTGGACNAVTMTAADVG